MIGVYLELLAAAAMLTCCVWAAYVAAVRICPAAPLSVRCCATVLAAAWLQVAVFEVLASLHAFRLAVALPVWAAVAVAAHFCLADRNGLRRQFGADWQALRHAGGGIGSGEARVVLILTAALSVAHLLRGLVAPPLAWDSLTYQFVRPAEWVQAGALVTQTAPDAWSYYAHFPYTGNVFWAWAMLPVHGDLLLSLMDYAIWLSLQLAAYTVARLLGAERAVAVLGALTIGTTPAVFSYLTAGYVDNALLAMFLLGTVFLIRTFSGHRREALPAVAALGLAAGIKLTGVVLLGLISVPLAAYLLWPRIRGFRNQSSIHYPLSTTHYPLPTTHSVSPTAHCPPPTAYRLLPTAFCLLPAALVGIMPYLRNWVSVGSPLYPQGLRLFGVDVFPGNQQLADVLAGRVFGEPQHISEGHFLWMTLVPGRQFTSLGLVAPLLIGFGLAGLFVLLRRENLRIPVALTAICSAVIVLLVYSPSTHGVRAHWPGTCGRFLMPALACCVLWSTALGRTRLGRAAKWSFYLAIGFGLLLGLPRGWSLVDAQAVGIAAACLAAAYGGVWIYLRRRNRRSRVGVPQSTTRFPRMSSADRPLPATHQSLPTARRLLPTISAMVLLITTLMPLLAVRAYYRYDIYRAAEARQSWVTHQLHTDYASAWPIWQYFNEHADRPAARSGNDRRRIAVTAGWEDAGHNWYRYPLLGSRLQNQLLYVPITDDGRIVNYRDLDPRTPRADFDAWLGRLIDRRVEYVVSLAPDNTLESQWMARHPALFEPVAESVNRQSRAYRFRRTAAVRVARTNQMRRKGI